MSYQGIVTKIVDIKNHPNADRLNIAKACNFPVVTSKETEEGTLGVFFQEGGSLSVPFLRENNLFRHSILNKDKEKTGLFEDKGKIRAQKIRGVASEGIWLPIESVLFTGVDIKDLKEGLMFNSLNGIEICQKYVTKKTKQAGVANAPKEKKVSLKKIYPQFQEHFDTQQLKYYLDHIPVGAIISISEKIHGTSGRTGNLVKRPDYLATEKPTKDFEFKLLFKSPTRYLKKLNKYNKKVIKYIVDSNKAKRYKGEEEYEFVSGSRRRILNLKGMEDSFYRDCDFRKEIHDRLKRNFPPIPKGMTLYYEIVGFTDQKNPIMGSHGLKKEMKELKSLYGDSIVYSYGCNQEDPIPYKIYIYRITNTVENEKPIELSYHQLIDTCKVLNLNYVPVLKEPFIYDGDKQKLLSLCEELAQGPSTLDSKHLKEGVVIKVEYPGFEKSFKFKSFDFLVLEGVIKENEDYVDEEEVNS
jgi:hypothetical protein